jgi:hypothetical protein
LREIIEFVLRTTGRRPTLISLPFGVAGLMAQATEIASMLSLGAFPEALVTTRDQLALLRQNNVVSRDAIEQDRTLRALAITAQGLEAIAPAYLYRFRKTGQFASSSAT